MKEKKTLKTNLYKGIVDFALIAGMVGCFISTTIFKGRHGGSGNGHGPSMGFSWTTTHCIISYMFMLLLSVHIWQHWKLIKGIIQKNLYSKNIMTSITAMTFILTVISFLLYFNGFSHSKGEFHSSMAYFFLLVAVTHIILNFKKMLSLFDGHSLRGNSFLFILSSKNYNQKDHESDRIDKKSYL